MKKAAAILPRAPTSKRSAGWTLALRPARISATNTKGASTVSIAAPTKNLILGMSAAAAMLGVSNAATAQDTPPNERPYEVEWVYRVQYGHQEEWWKIFQRYQIAILDREKQLGYVTKYVVERPGLHTTEDSRWDYRVVINYANWAGSTHEGEVQRALFPDQTVLKQEEQRRWELTLNHWDLPIHEIDPHAPAE
jgi:hypothetical protein